MRYSKMNEQIPSLIQVFAFGSFFLENNTGKMSCDELCRYKIRSAGYPLTIFFICEECIIIESNLAGSSSIYNLNRCYEIH